MKRVFLLIGCASFISFGLVSADQPVKADYSIVNRIHLEGDGGWDCARFDDVNGHLFVSHENQVHVLDASTGKQIGLIKDTKGVHDIAAVQDLNKAYISNGKDASVSVVDLKTFAMIKKIKATGEGADAVTYDPFSGAVYVFNGNSSNATVIDANTDSIKATVDLEGGPEFSASNGNGLLYVNLEDKGQVEVIDIKTNKIVTKWPVAPASKPCAMAIDIKDHLLYIGCRSKVMLVIDELNGNIITSLPIGDHVDGAAFDPSSNRVFFSNGEGMVTVVEKSSRTSFKVLENIPTQKGAKTMAISLKTHHLYLPCADYEAAPAATADNPKPKAPVKSGTFTVLDIAPTQSK